MYEQVEHVSESIDHIRLIVDALKYGAHHDHDEVAEGGGHDSAHPGVLQCLHYFRDLVPLNLLLVLSLECEVAAASHHADQENGQTRVWLHVVHCPVFILVSEVADGEVVSQYDNELNEGVEAEQAEHYIEELLPLARVVVERREQGEQQEELEVVRQVPRPRQARVGLRPRHQVVQEGYVPKPVLATLRCRLVHEEKRAVTTEEDKELPEEKDCEEVKR